MAPFSPLDPATEQPPADWALLGRYIAGECTDAERAWMDQWLMDRPERQRYLDSLRREVEAVHVLGPEFATESGWGAVSTRLHLGRPRPREIRAQLQAPVSRWSWIPWAVAACVITLVAARSFVHSGATQPVQELTTPAGSHALITLRDGTRVVMGPGSHIRIPRDYGRQTRAVELDGEGYFTVVHNAAMPFTVHAGRTTVTDVGTVFDVQAYAIDRVVRVAVAQGAVALGTTDGRSVGEADGQRLGAGDIAVVTDANVAVTHGGDIGAALAWLQGRLVFNETSMAEVARTLSRVFNLSVTIADSAIAVEHFTGSYDNETANQVLDEITRSAGARYERSGRVVVIRRGLARASRPQARVRRPLTTVDARTHDHP